VKKETKVDLGRVWSVDDKHKALGWLKEVKWTLMKAMDAVILKERGVAVKKAIKEMMSTGYTDTRKFWWASWR